MNTDLFLNPQVNQYGSHMIMTNVHQSVSKHTIINIDTKFCDEYSNNRLNSADFNYNLSEFNFTIPDKMTGVKSMTIKSVEIPMTYYNISAAFGNNYFVVQVLDASGGNVTGTVPIIIPDGFYDYTSLATAINTAISVIPGLIFSISSLLVSEFVVDSDTDVFYNVCFNLDNSGDFLKYNFKSKMGWLLGFRNLQYSINRFSRFNSESCFNLNQKYLYLAIDDYSNSIPVSFLSGMPKHFINKNIIAKILLDRSHFSNGAVLVASTHNGLLIPDTRIFSGDKHNIQKLNIKLLDENGKIINLNGNDFSFTMYLEKL